ncbi:glycoside hydrolase family 20 protein [Parapedobacter tibetensis]|uniref:glycoside hydrolase family 20 protein n=1 Tax=Parapedobacter tibetensis TaxID=2972951 RepID=UPI00214DA3AA|nr:glycoside hydrolase family 20 protein [Parapedobacter tibetensis]
MAQYALRLMLGVIIVLSIPMVSAHAQGQVSIIPRPSVLEIHEGKFVFPATTSLHAFEPFMEVASLLSEHPHTNFMEVERIKSRKRVPESGVRLVQAEGIDKLPSNAYRLTVDTSGIVLMAHQPEAMINGIMTLLQLAYTQPDGGALPAMLIEDRPRFGYRGLHLDVSRHFYPLSFLKKFIDLMALYKFNRFHWHLTDGPGWRLEIKKYPELTQYAAWRTHVAWKDWWHNGRRYLDEGHPNASGGYYTQDEARELVAYAARKGITVIPEIEMPGHSEAVLAAYPQLSCRGEPHKHAEYCIGNAETFTFLTDVLTEVMDIFPSEYIHIGGDEANKESWKTCAKCQALMGKEGLKDVDELQSYAVKQMDQFLQSNGRKLVGWDEILEGGLSSGATVMSWRGEQGGIDAANAGHDVIMTPNSHLYFDYYQSDPRTQPEAIGGYIPLSKVYAYDPIPKEIAADKTKHVLGAQGNIWTEYMPTQEHVEYMAFPRALALAEVLWSAQERRDWDGFSIRLRRHYTLLQQLHVNYYRPSYEVDIAIDFNADTQLNIISLLSEQHENNIHYTIDGSKPTVNSPLYSKPFELSVPATIKAAYFRDSARMGGVTEDRADLHKAIGKKVTYHTKWNDRYPAQGEATLTNGQKGELTYGDGQWQGFLNDLDITIDFERREAIQSLAIRFMQHKGPGIFMPGEVKILLSDNGKNFRETGIVVNDISKDDPSLQFKTFELEFDAGQTARYVRVVATNVNQAFLFTDEIVIY